MKIERSSGILMHITSLPGPFGIGDLGPEAYKFLDFIEASGHRYWQLLPLNPTDTIYKHSPYSTHSAFAGNPLLISPELLVKSGFIGPQDLKTTKKFRPNKVIFSEVEAFKEELFEFAWKKFSKKQENHIDFGDFQDEQSFWLDDYCLYLSLRNKFDGKSWLEWPEELRDRDPKALKKAHNELDEPIKKEKFIQYLFFSQWRELMAEAHKRKIKFFGDVPFYINHDSADCWVNPGLFKLDNNKNPTHVSGVPPDLFSNTGQLWGTPVYDWKHLKNTDFEWWVARLKQNLLLFDVVRLDHFRAFSAYWEVPAGEKTAIKGKWVNTPGIQFFKILKDNFPEMPFIAEDLGSLDQPVYDLLEKFDFPGMKVLQFAFGDHYSENPYLPFNHLPNNVVYTGTHDNNTSRGWFKTTSKRVKLHLKEYTGIFVSDKNIHQVFHRMALKSVANLAIIPMQDIVGLGGEAIMNVPGSMEGNWTWRLKKSEMPDEKQIKKLFHLNVIYGRAEERIEKEI